MISHVFLWASYHEATEEIAWSYFRTYEEARPTDTAGCGQGHLRQGAPAYHGDEKLGNAFPIYPKRKNLSALGIASWDPNLESFNELNQFCSNCNFVRRYPGNVR